MSITTDFTPAEVAAAGGHNLLVKNGASGKAAHPSRSLDPGKIVFLRPTTTAAAIFGKRDHGAKGALEKAHQGTVILDDATRFSPAILDSIRTAHDAKRVRLYKGNNIAPNVNESADFRLIIGTRGRTLRPPHRPTARPDRPHHQHRRRHPGRPGRTHRRPHGSGRTAHRPRHPHQRSRPPRPAGGRTAPRPHRSAHPRRRPRPGTDQPARLHPHSPRGLDPGRPHRQDHPRN